MPCRCNGKISPSAQRSKFKLRALALRTYPLWICLAFWSSPNSLTTLALLTHFRRKETEALSPAEATAILRNWLLSTVQPHSVLCLKMPAWQVKSGRFFVLQMKIMLPIPGPHGIGASLSLYDLRYRHSTTAHRAQKVNRHLGSAAAQGEGDATSGPLLPYRFLLMDSQT